MNSYISIVMDYSFSEWYTNCVYDVFMYQHIHMIRSAYYHIDFLNCRVSMIGWAG